MKLKLINFDEASFDAYKSWFTDKTLNKYLGPMDNETWEIWQTHTTQGEKVEELAAYLDNELVAVIQICLPTKEHRENCISSIATNPQKKRMGIGSIVLKHLLQSTKFQKCKIWISHVDPKNKSAIRFFEKHGWKERGIEHDMITYEFNLK